MPPRKSQQSSPPSRSHGEAILTPPHPPSDASVSTDPAEVEEWKAALAAARSPRRSSRQKKAPTKSLDQDFSSPVRGNKTFRVAHDDDDDDDGDHDEDDDTQDDGEGRNSNHDRQTARGVASHISIELPAPPFDAVPSRASKRSKTDAVPSHRQSSPESADESDADRVDDSDNERPKKQSAQSSLTAQPKSLTGSAKHGMDISKSEHSEENSQERSSDVEQRDYRAVESRPTSAKSMTPVSIKRISGAAGSSLGRSSPASGEGSPGPSAGLTSGAPSPHNSFFGKPLTTLLNSGAARRPGLTRKTKIPSLLNHRGPMKPRVNQLPPSKRKLADDDYEYDPIYEAMLAAKRPKDGSEDEDQDDQHDGENLPPQIYGDEDDAIPVDGDIEYD
ncbi:hypothetical protein BCV70DRAFT_199998 [Testicularia cyperi]|uniref:Uncharacterized protein n=1 Tax=Testicularia cyperi TaxID=1882483 RepID=A0A317XQU6_9BASI|nr:hypothetical protein BCV70DRAFT_199998 [Testicularia cyperi]